MGESCRSFEQDIVQLGLGCYSSGYIFVFYNNLDVYCFCVIGVHGLLTEVTGRVVREVPVKFSPMGLLQARAEAKVRQFDMALQNKDSMLWGAQLYCVQ